MGEKAQMEAVAPLGEGPLLSDTRREGVGEGESVTPGAGSRGKSRVLSKGYCFLCEMAGLVRRQETGENLAERCWLGRGLGGNVNMGQGGGAELTHSSTLTASQVPTEHPLPPNGFLTS